MTKELWINLPSKDLARTRQFYRDIGFTFNANFPGGDSAVSLLVGNPAVVVMLFPEETFASFASSDASDARAAAEVLLSLGADSRGGSGRAGREGGRRRRRVVRQARREPGMDVRVRIRRPRRTPVERALYG
ncbi:hypothetical protein OMP38_28425 [Cohnella ginsengisoli]|uniref:Glyoxalase/Bleomycin resistance-like N-terminal domain-containing protein n=1 Tax=Cohnella ginsengisoli TaxID=425004 RepID=A0A9X4KLM0_9BACL|nr:hypothetical protein [Cohnella ginsengisoli]MDG0794323.1 hypothetical protein [Cohnella ginsengisoli]